MSRRLTPAEEERSPSSPGLDIAGCDREPIHVPGSIQPHGRLLVLSAGTAMPAVSAADRLSAAAGTRLDMVLADGDAARVAAALAEGVTGPSGSPLPGLAARDGTGWDGLLHRPADGPALLELEPHYPGQIVPRDLLARLNQALTAIQRAGTDRDAAAAAAGAVRAISGFDRVMTYRFAADWAGEVIAEALGPGTTGSYLGLHFPASDIPVQARELYRRNPLRLIPDAGYAPLALLPDRHPDTGAPIDLGPAILRSVSPVHLRYLANMGVRASMSVSVLRRNGALWGLIACHHLAEPRFVGYEAREACLLLGRALSWRLSELEEEAVAARTARVRFLQADLFRAFDDTKGSLGSVISGRAEDALALVGAGGLAFCGMGDGPALFGGAPGPLAGAVPPWLDGMSVRETLVSDRLPAILADAEADAAAASGLLATPLPAGEGWMLWFRPELRRTVSWAGNPDKPVEPGQGDGPAMLSPRHSFAAWQEEVRGRSLPWSSADVAAAEALRDTVADAMARRATRLERENRALAERNEELGLFADAASHDLKEPLWQVEVFGGLLKEDLRGAADASEMAEMASAIADSAGRMRVMIDELAAYARAGRRPEQLLPARLDELAGDAARDLGERLRAAGCAAPEFVGDWDTAVVCDHVQIYRVFQNLLSNAVKYRSPDRPLHLRLRAEAVPGAGGGRVRVTVADNGAGFEPCYADAVFQPFRRLAVKGAEPTEGTGLGLALCRRIVAAHGGEMSVDAVPDHGAAFWFTLPVAGPRPQGGPGAAP